MRHTRLMRDQPWLIVRRVSRIFMILNSHTRNWKAMKGDSSFCNKKQPIKFLTILKSGQAF